MFLVSVLCLDGWVILLSKYVIYLIKLFIKYTIIFLIDYDVPQINWSYL